jgi:hypothetical protein
VDDRKRFLKAGKFCLFSLIKPSTATVSKQDLLLPQGSWDISLSSNQVEGTVCESRKNTSPYPFVSTLLMGMTSFT